MKCGIGNWNEVAEQPWLKQRNFSPQECEDHYYAFYKGTIENLKDRFIIDNPALSQAPNPQPQFYNGVFGDL